jgi:hypothetical protein
MNRLNLFAIPLATLATSLAYAGPGSIFNLREPTPTIHTTPGENTSAMTRIMKAEENRIKPKPLPPTTVKLAEFLSRTGQVKFADSVGTISIDSKITSGKLLVSPLEAESHSSRRFKEDDKNGTAYQVDGHVLKGHYMANRTNHAVDADAVKIVDSEPTTRLLEVNLTANKLDEYSLRMSPAVRESIKEPNVAHSYEVTLRAKKGVDASREQLLQLAKDQFTFDPAEPSKISFASDSGDFVLKVKFTSKPKEGLNRAIATTTLQPGTTTGLTANQNLTAFELVGLTTAEESKNYRRVMSNVDSKSGIQFVVYDLIPTSLYKTTVTTTAAPKSAVSSAITGR